MYPNVQAYDRGTMLSPDGRLYQVEYAKESVRKGATAMGIVTSDTVVFVAHKNITEPLAIPSSSQKIFRIDSYIGATFSGIAADGLRVINLLRNKTQSHRMVFDETQSVDTVARDLSEEMQLATQYGGMRPYAVSLLVGGIDASPKLFEIEPTASLLGYKAVAIGTGKKVAEDILVKEYKDDIKTEDAISLGVKIISKASETKLNNENIEISIIDKKNGYSVFSPDKISKYL